MNYTEMKNKIIKAKDAYYNSDTPIMSDSEFDALWDEFKSLYPEDELCSSIGSPISEVTEWEKKEHTIPMCSLDKVNTVEEFEKWCCENNSEFIIEDKADGISIELCYEDGKLISCITRGDGKIGEDIYSNVIKMKNVVKELPNDCKINNLRGEILILRDDFEQINYLLTLEKEKELKNPRNAATGISKRYDGQFAEYCTILYYECDGEFETEFEKLQYIESLGLKTINYKKVTKKEAIEEYNLYCESKRSEILYDIDGLVVKINSIQKQEELGYNASKNPNFSIAWKFPAMKVKTKILDVIWQLGDGGEGRITPVAILEPVKCGGVTITRATLNNVEIFDSFDLHYNDLLLVSRANDVIPKILENLTKDHENNLKISHIEYCPVCREKTEISGKFLICPNLNCKGKEIGNLNRWIDALNIMDISEKTINLLYNNGLIKEPADFYKLNVEDISCLERMGEKSAEKIVNNLVNNIVLDLSTFISGLNIPNFSKSRAELLIENGIDNLEKMLKATKEDLVKIKGIESKTAELIVNGLLNKRKTIFNLLTYITIKERTIGKLNGLSFCVTGALNTMDRKEFIAKVTQNGGSYKSSVVKGLTYLVTNDTESGSSKNKKAKENGVKIINEQEFLTLIGE